MFMGNLLEDLVGGKHGCLVFFIAKIKIKLASVYRYSYSQRQRLLGAGGGQGKIDRS